MEWTLRGNSDSFGARGSREHGGMAWFARMDHQSQEVLRAATVALGWGLNSFLYLPQLSFSYYA